MNIKLKMFENTKELCDKSPKDFGLPFAIFFVVQLLIAFTSLHTAEAAGFKVTGEMTYWEHSSTNTSKQQAWTFEVSVIGNQWLETIHGENGQADLFGSDGTSVYWVFQDERAKKRRNLTAFVGSVFDGSYPFQSVGVFTALPWVAYCSGNILRGATNGEIVLPAPWLIACHDPEAHFYRSHYTELPDSGGLPSRLDYQLDEELMTGANPS